jgi:stearoyl-CoA desaturase (delta-9 desaturase)
MIFTLIGTLGGTMSSIAFIGIHRAHHAYSDEDKDPHNLRAKGWRLLFSLYDFEVDPRFVKDLLRDPFHRFLHKYYTVIVAGWVSFLLLVNPLIGVFCFFVPVFLQITIANLGNILLHRHGYRNFDLPDNSVNNVLISILAWGEGWHNNHHASL